MTKFLTMNDKILTNSTENHPSFIQKTRNKLAVLQEMGLERNENKLRELLKDERDLVPFPIPLFLPAFLVWLFMLLFPLVLILDPTNAFKMSVNIKGLVGFYLPMLSTVFIFILNQRFLVPQLVFKKRYAIYFVCNAILVVATLFFREVAFFVMERTSNEGVADFFSSYCFSFVKGHFGVWPVISFTILVAFVCVLCVLYHVMFRQIVRAFVLREQKRSELQYELDFLKNQLSPHFLFNTLNNISALIQIARRRRYLAEVCRSGKTSFGRKL